ncbi:phosphodiester glycosidase family protein [Streptacidiphilus sp. PB12-B1b]|uniref:phosphodiester glycosidase family protein n=1 Tax=Streptacidiphilus sp. PB12-B1b TaxID=2705012 RepID=UPI0015F900BB|nr:phosphodiester glycosidase family protein [Streptacidiphilus sp. PB12-B1b]QMU77021.1 phosphodiester glycosidase family protein [Streptacidiphilus sp. PB12-B1b]
MALNRQDACDSPELSGEGPPPSHPVPAPGGRRRRGALLWSALTVPIVGLALAVYCIHAALAAPGRQGATAKLARWGRCHHLVVVADLVDGRARAHSAPSAECSPDGYAELRREDHPDHAARLARSAAARAAAAVIPLHRPVRPLVSPALPGEGVFTPLVTVKGQPVLQSATMRPDDSDSDFPVGVVWMHRTALRFELHPGVSEPGGDWPVPATLAPGRRTGLVAAYNGGFKLSNGDSHGGFYLDGRYGAPLVDGAASEVFHRDGSLTVGAWNRDVAMAPDVVGVRQCLVPLVSGGAVTEAVQDGGVDVWGLTDGGNSYVPRSGVGVDRNGDVIYVGGRLLSVETLATVLQRAGAVNAMMLDINLSWPSFISYDGSRDPHDPVPHNLVNFVRDPTRYYDESSRDFVAVYARG